MTLIQKRVVYIVVPLGKATTAISVHEEKTGPRGANRQVAKWKELGAKATILTRSVR